MIDPLAGQYMVYSFAGGKYTAVFDWTSDNSINPAPGAINRLEVIADNEQILFLINGHPVASTKTPPASGGSMLALIAAAPDKTPGDYRFTNLVVKQPPDPMQSPVAAAPSASPGESIFSDNFQTLDPSWGYAGSGLEVAGGQLRNSMDANSNILVLNDKYTYGQADASVDLTVAPGSDPAASGSLVFWGADSGDLTTFEIEPKNKTFDATQVKNWRPTFLINPKKSDAINDSDGATNLIGVAIRGDSAYLLINGQNVGELQTPKPSPPGGLIGLLGLNIGAAHSDVSFSNFAITEPLGSGPPTATEFSAPPPPPSALPGPAVAQSATPSSGSAPAGAAASQPPSTNFFQSLSTLPSSPPAVSTASAAPPPPQAPGPGESVVLADNFQTFSPLWGKPDNTLSVQNGMLVAQLARASVATRLNTAYRYYDADISFDERMASGPAASGVDLMFWLQDARHYDYLFVGADGLFRVTQVSGTTLTTIVPPQTSSAIKGAGQWNVVKLSIRGNAAALSVNGVSLVQFAGNPPIFGGPVGLSGAGGAGGPSTIEFANFQVAAPTPAHLTLGPVNVSTAAPVLAPASVGNNPVLEDDFLTFDPSWGGVAGIVSVVGGNLRELAAHGAVAGVFNSRYLYDDADIRYNLQLEQTAQQADTVASLFFWTSKGNTDEYILSVSPAGYVRVFHRIGAQSLNLTPWVAAAGFRPGVGQVNTIGLSLRGNQGTVSVNGRSVTQFSGTAPPGGGTMGLAMVASKSGASSWNFSKLQIWVPTSAVADK